MSSEILKVAVIGAGIGGSHIEGYRALPECYEVSMVCDLDTDRAKGAAKDLPNCKIVSDIADVLADGEIDIVDNCLPPHLHFSVTMDALAAGKHVVCEKPFTTSLAEADQVLKLAGEVGKSVFPVFQYRYGLGFQRLIRLVKKNMVGRAYSASLETHWQRGSAYYSVPWRGTWAGECGGVIIGHAIHIHNLATHLLGPVAKVGAFLDTRVNPIETEDSGAISMQMECGALVTSSITLGSATDMSRMRICYEHVTAESGLQPYTIGAGDWTFKATDPARQAEFDAEIGQLNEVPERFHGMLLEVYKSLNGDADASPPDSGDARHSIELITAIYQSDRDGKIVSLPIDESHSLYTGWSLEKTTDA